MRSHSNYPDTPYEPLLAKAAYLKKVPAAREEIPHCRKFLACCGPPSVF